MRRYTVTWRGVVETFPSFSEALDRWERLDALGLEPAMGEIACS